MRFRTLSSCLLAAALFVAPLGAAAQEGPLDEAKKLVDRAAYTEALDVLAPLSSGKDTARAALLRAEIELRTGKYVEAEKTAER